MNESLMSGYYVVVPSVKTTKLTSVVLIEYTFVLFSCTFKIFFKVIIPTVKQYSKAVHWYITAQIFFLWSTVTLFTCVSLKQSNVYLWLLVMGLISYVLTLEWFSLFSFFLIWITFRGWRDKTIVFHKKIVVIVEVWKINTMLCFWFSAIWLIISWHHSSGRRSIQIIHLS